MRLTQGEAFFLINCCIALIANVQLQLSKSGSSARDGGFSKFPVDGTPHRQDRIFTIEGHVWRKTTQPYCFHVITEVQVMAAQSSMLCVLHVSSSFHSSDVKTFDDGVWGRVCAANKTRKDKPCWRTSKYADVCANLPETFSEHDGYHTQCYKNFTAVSMDVQGETQTKEKNVFLRSESKSSDTCCFDMCLFCNKKHYRRSGGKSETIGTCASTDAEENIRDAAVTLNDSKLLTKISNIDFISRKVKYHHTCRRAYLRRAEILNLQPTNTSHPNQSNDNAFRKLIDYIEEHVVKASNAI